MNKKITIGQFIPKKSIIHHLDPRTKIIWVFFYLIMAFAAVGFYSLLLVFGLLFLFLLLSKTNFFELFSAIRPLIFLIVFTAFLNIFYIQGGHVFYSFYFFQITSRGVASAFAIMVRLFCLVSASSLLTLVTSLDDLVFALEKMMGPLKKIKLPVSEISLMIMITLRFIPAFSQELQNITDAQKSRGARFDQGNLFKRIKSYFPLILPLFMSAFKKAFELTEAIESRAYSAKITRGHFKNLSFSFNDLLAFIFLPVIFFSVIWLDFV